MSVFSSKYYAGGALALILAMASPVLASAADTEKGSFPPAADAQAQAPAPAQPYKGICNSFLTRREAKNRFFQQMTNVKGEPRIFVKKFTNVKETQYIKGPETYDIDRHYCSATVIMSDGSSHPATYIVARNQGFAAIGGFRVSFCVEGYDNWLIRDNDCRALRAPVDSVY